MIILGLFVHLLEKVLETLITSMIGAYFSVRGVSFFLGGYPDEELLSILIYYREICQLKRLLMGRALRYVIGMLLALIISIFIQKYTSLKQPEDKQDLETKKIKD